MPESRCPNCGARLPDGTRADLCPFCVPEDDDADPTPNYVLGDYELLEVIGRGGMGVVWRGHQRRLHRDVAVKILPGGDLAGAEARARFQVEAEATARLKHPNIVPIYEAGESEGTPFLVMELVEGRPLNEVLHHRPASPKRAARWLRDVALAVQHAHDHGVLHRDLKPSNILIEPGDESGSPRVTDFGLAKFVDSERSLTAAGSVVGSPAYMAPEQARRGAFSARSDVYGLGAVLYYTLTGRPPFQADSIASLLAQVETEEPLPPSRVRRMLNAEGRMENGSEREGANSVPSAFTDLETICLKCLEKEPALRYASARELAEDLARFLEGQVVRARPVGAAGKLLRLAWRRPWHTTAIALGAAMLVGIGVTLAWKVRTERLHGLALTKEQAATRVAMIRSQLSESRAIIQLRQADSRPRAEAILGQLQQEDLPDDLRAQARDLTLAAQALPTMRAKPLLGEGVTTEDWTFAAGDLPRERWALATFRGEIVLRSIHAATNALHFSTAPRVVTALIAFSPGGRWLAIRHRDELAVWDTTPGATQRLAFVTKPWGQGNKFGFGKIALSPDDTAVLWPDGREVVASALPGGRELGRWSGVEGRRCEAVAFVPDGKSFAVARTDEAVVDLRSWPDGRLQRSFNLRAPAPFAALAFTTHAEWIAGGDAKGRITIWRGDGSTKSSFEMSHSAGIRSLKFSADGRYLASTGEDESLRVWDGAARAELPSLPFECGVVSFSRDGLRLGVGFAGGKLSLAELALSPILRRFKPETPHDMLQTLSFHPDGRSAFCLVEGGTARYSIPDGSPLAFFPAPNARTLVAEPSDHGGLIIAGLGGVERYRLKDPTKPPVLLARNGNSMWGSTSASADGRWMAAGNKEYAETAVWPAGDLHGDRVKILKAGVGGLGEAALSPDGSRLARADITASSLMILDVAGGSVIRRLPLESRHAITWSPDGHWLAGAGSTWPLWDTTSWELVTLPALEPNSSWFASAAFSWPGPKGRSTYLAVTTGSKRIALLELATRRILATLEAPEPRSIFKLEFSKDGRWLGAACSGGEIQLWDFPAVEAQLRRDGFGGDVR